MENTEAIAKIILRLSKIFLFRKNNIKTIELSSMDENSDKFYTAIGMEEKGKVLMTHYEGDEAWMKAFLKAK